MVPNDSPPNGIDRSDGAFAATLPEVRDVKLPNGTIQVRELPAEELVRVFPSIDVVLRASAAGIPVHQFDDEELEHWCRICAATTDVPVAAWKKAGQRALATVGNVALSMNLDFYVLRAEAKVGVAAMTLPQARGDGTTSSPT